MRHTVYKSRGATRAAHVRSYSGANLPSLKTYRTAFSEAAL